MTEEREMEMESDETLQEGLNVQERNKKKLVDVNGDIDEDLYNTSSLVNLEHEFYQQGFSSGWKHGKLHGIFEGRALGQEKGWELWEEVGYYSGVAKLWHEALMFEAGNGSKISPPSSSSSSSSSRAIVGAKQVLTLTSEFPLVNNNASNNNNNNNNNNHDNKNHPNPQNDDMSPPSNSVGHHVSQAQSSSNSMVDIPSHLAAIRSKYRTLCALLGVRARITGQN